MTPQWEREQLPDTGVGRTNRRWAPGNISVPLCVLAMTCTHVRGTTRPPLELLTTLLLSGLLKLTQAALLSCRQARWLSCFDFPSAFSIQNRSLLVVSSGRPKPSQVQPPHHDTMPHTAAGPVNPAEGTLTGLQGLSSAPPPRLRDTLAHAVAGPHPSRPRQLQCQGCHSSVRMLLQVHTHPGHACPSARTAAPQPHTGYTRLPDKRGAGLHCGRHPAVHRHLAPVGRESGPVTGRRHQQVRLKTWSEAPVRGMVVPGLTVPSWYHHVCAVLLSGLLTGFSEWSWCNH